jgi:hypothetical protein
MPSCVLLAQQRLPRQGFVAGFQRPPRPVMPFLGLPTLVIQFFGELLFACHRVNHALAGAVDVFLHFADELFDHPLRVLDPIHQIVEIGGEYITDALE